MTDAGSGGAFIRPFVITGGRTEVHHSDLQIDTLLSALPGGRTTTRGFEHRAVLARCESPMTIADLAVDLDLPVGVVTVMVDDLLDDNLLLVHRRAAAVPLSVLERLVEGVRAL